MNHDNCPICREPYELQCRCLLNDRTCLNGHQWHRCGVCSRVVIGESDHGKGTTDAVNLCMTCRGHDVEHEIHHGGEG